MPLGENATKLLLKMRKLSRSTSTSTISTAIHSPQPAKIFKKKMEELVAGIAHIIKAESNMRIFAIIVTKRCVHRILCLNSFVIYVSQKKIISCQQIFMTFFYL